MAPAVSLTQSVVQRLVSLSEAHSCIQTVDEPLFDESTSEWLIATMWQVAISLFNQAKSLFESTRTMSVVASLSSVFVNEFGIRLDIWAPTLHQRAIMN